MTAMYYVIRAAANIEADLQRGFSTFENPEVFKAGPDFLDGQEQGDDFNRFLCQAAKAGSVDVDPYKYSEEGVDAPSSWKKVVGFFIELGCRIDPRHTEIRYHDGFKGWVLTHGKGLSCYDLGEFATDEEALAAAENCGIGYSFCKVPKNQAQREIWLEENELGCVTYGYGSKTRGQVRLVAELDKDAYNGRTRYLLACTEQPVKETAYS